MKSDRFVNLHAMICRKMSIKKIIFLSEYFSPNRAKIIACLSGNRMVKMEDSYLGMLHNDPCPSTDNYVVVVKNQLQSNRLKPPLA